MEITKFSISVLRNDGHFQFHTEFKELLQKDTPEKLKVKALYDEYISAYEREDEAFKKIRKSKITKMIKDADDARDEILSAIIDIVRGMTKHFNIVIKAAANNVKIVLDTYGKIAHKSYSEETSAIYNLVQELSGQKYQADINILGLSALLEELKMRNEEVKILVDRRHEETVGGGDIVLRDARKKTDEEYFKIRKRINALVEVEGENDYEHFVRMLNDIISTYKHLLPRHRGEKQDEEEEENEE